MGLKKDSELLSSAMRCFDVLELINSYRLISGAELAKVLKVPRTTVMRSVRTLAKRGYVSRSEVGQFSPTLETRRLSFKCSTMEDVLPHVRQILSAAADDYLWPLALAVPHGDMMYTYAPTDALTPYKLVSTPESTQLPYLGTAAGIAFLAFCDEEERVAILRMASVKLSKEDLPLSDIESEMRLAKMQGYCVKNSWRIASRRQREMYKGQTVIAVPVVVNGRVQGCLTTRIISSALQQSDIKTKICPRLNKIAAQVSSVWQANVSSGKGLDQVLVAHR